MSRPRIVKDWGLPNNEIWIVGEAPGQSEISAGLPFVGASGRELDTLLSACGKGRDSLFLTNVTPFQPPGNDIGAFFLDKKRTQPGAEIHSGLQELQEKLDKCKPKLVIGLGGTALWAFTGQTSITKWRGSQMHCRDFATAPLRYEGAFLPTYHPAAVLRMYPWRFITQHDLRRAFRWAATLPCEPPLRNYIIRPTRHQVDSVLDDLENRLFDGPVRLSVDFETRYGHIACLGIAWSCYDSLCIPFMCVERKHGYWDFFDELHIIKRVRLLLKHKNALVVGQNLAYDNQYFAKHWGYTPRVHLDTMVAHHTMWPGTPKALDYLASLYCEYYLYWKDDGKFFDLEHHSEDRLWWYNCLDTTYTWEISVELETLLEKQGKTPQFHFQQYRVAPALQQVMLRGVRTDNSLRDELSMDLTEKISDRENLLQTLLGHSVNPRSPKQLQELFYGDFGIRPIVNRKTGRPTTDEDALTSIAKREPLLARVCHSINEIRQIGVARNVINTQLDTDGRLRCSYNIAGTSTFRLASSENAFGSGTNLQNWSKGKRSEETGLELPNTRRLIVPDPGMILADIDLDRADLQVVVWEADDTEMKQMLREGVDMHKENARVISGLTSVSQVTPQQRQMAKMWVHGTNYGGSARTMAMACGITVHQSEQAQQRWFAAHPGIKAWHRRVEQSLMATRGVRNAFGFGITFFDRVESLLPEALAWIPQSTVGLVINMGMCNIVENLPQVQVLLQVHDSLAVQFPTELRDSLIPQIEKQMLITIPYEDPLVIPVGFALSERSWGDCE